MNPEFLFYSSTKYTTSGYKDIRISNLVKLITSLIQISQTWNSIRSTNSSVTCTPLGCKDMRVSNLEPKIIDLCMKSFHIQSLYFFAVHTLIRIFMIYVCRDEKGGGGRVQPPPNTYENKGLSLALSQHLFLKTIQFGLFFKQCSFQTALKCMTHRKTWLSC